MSDNFKAKNCYERLYQKPLSKREVFEMDNRLTQFFEILIEIDQQNKEQNNDKNNRSSDNTNQAQ